MSIARLIVNSFDNILFDVQGEPIKATEFGIGCYRSKEWSVINVRWSYQTKDGIRVDTGFVLEKPGEADVKNGLEGVVTESMPIRADNNTIASVQKSLAKLPDSAFAMIQIKDHHKYRRFAHHNEDGTVNMRMVSEALNLLKTAKGPKAKLEKAKKHLMAHVFNEYKTTMAPQVVDDCVKAVTEQKIKDYKKKYGKKPDKEALKEIKSSAWKICQTQYKKGKL